MLKINLQTISTQLRLKLKIYILNPNDFVVGILSRKKKNQLFTFELFCFLMFLFKSLFSKIINFVMNYDKWTRWIRKIVTYIELKVK